MASVWVDHYETKLGTKYFIRQEDDNGKTTVLKEKFYSKNIANKRAQEISDTLTEGKVVKESHKIKDCHATYLAHRAKLVENNLIAPNTYRINETNLRSFVEKFGERPDDEIEKDELEVWKNQLLTKKAPAGVNIIIRNFSQFFNFCKQSGHIKESPAKGVKEFDPKKIKVWRVLDRKELAHFMKSCSPRMKHLRKATYVLYNTSMRSGEFLRMDWKSLKTDSIIVTNKGKTRTIPLNSPPFPKLLRKLIVKFIANPINRNTFYSGWETLVEAADMGRVRPHDMRHTWASNMKEQGWPDDKIMEIAGWESDEMLRQYTHSKDNYITKMPRFKIR